MSEIILAIPQVAYDIIANALEEVGYGEMITQLSTGHTVRTFDMTGVAIMPGTDGDMIINSGRLSDYEIALGEEAYEAGYNVGIGGGAYMKGLDEYTPSEELLAMQARL